LTENRQDKRAAALQATLELISEQGFQGTPMSQIAERANIGVGTIYRYFASKDELINALYVDVKSRMAHYLFKDYSEDKPADETFMTFTRNMVDYFTQNPKVLLFIEQYANSPLITTDSHEEGLRSFEPAKALFKKAKKDGLMKDLPLEMICSLVFGSTLSLVKLSLFGKNKLSADDLDKGLQAVWDAVKK